MPTSRLPHLAALLLPLAALAGCQRAAAPAPPPPPAVTVSRPIVRDAVVWDEYTGRLEAVDTVDVHAQVSGYIQTAPFQEGALVKQGDVLFTLDARPFQAQLDNALGEVTQAQARLQLARNELTRAQQAPAAVSAEELDTRQQNVNQMQGALATAQAAADAARLNVDWCRVTAPLAGRIGRKLVTPGNLITGGGGAGASPTLLTTITSVDPMYCYIDVDESAVLRYQKQIREHRRVSARESRIPCTMALADEQEFTHEGSIDFVDNRVDPGTGTLRVRGVFPNPDGFLTPGMFARIRIAGDQVPHAILVADTAILADQNTRYVLTVDGSDTVQYHAVTPGPLFEGFRIVTQGVTADERVIVKGLMYARPGMKVQPQEAPMPAGPPAGTPGPSAATSAPAAAPAYAPSAPGAVQGSAAGTGMPPGQNPPNTPEGARGGTQNANQPAAGGQR